MFLFLVILLDPGSSLMFIFMAGPTCLKTMKSINELDNYKEQ